MHLKSRWRTDARSFYEIRTQIFSTCLFFFLSSPSLFMKKTWLRDALISIAFWSSLLLSRSRLFPFRSWNCIDDGRERESHHFAYSVRVLLLLPSLSLSLFVLHLLCHAYWLISVALPPFLLYTFSFDGNFPPSSLPAKYSWAPKEKNKKQQPK